MNESRKPHQAQIRITDEQYNYLEAEKRARNCSTSAYFRHLLIADMSKNIASHGDKGGITNGDK